MHGGRSEERKQRTYHRSGPSRSLAVYAAKANCIRCAMPMMPRSMLVIT